MSRKAQVVQSRVVKVDSGESWNFFIAQAKNQGCPVVVHFRADWCRPSTAMNPFFEQLALTYQHILFLSIDVDEVKGVASKMEIKAMPSFILMRDGTLVDKLVGANPDEIKKRIDGFAHSTPSYTITRHEALSCENLNNI
ncbi:hypothetical protein SLA2020_444590 [Shorea laevis]